MQMLMAFPCCLDARENPSSGVSIIRDSSTCSPRSPDLPQLKYFWAGKVADRANKGIPFQSDEGYLNLDAEGQFVKYEPVCRIFSALLDD